MYVSSIKDDVFRKSDMIYGHYNTTVIFLVDTPRIRSKVLGLRYSSKSHDALDYILVNATTNSSCKCVENKQEIRSVEHGICPISEFTSP